MANKYIVLDWQEVLYDEYMVFRKRSASCAPTTERTIHSAIFSFFTYMNSHNIQSLDAVTATTLKDWHVTSEHSTARARNLYTSQLRIFFEYLADHNMVPIDLPLALSCRHAPCTTVVKILTEEQLSAIDAYRSNASSPIQLRDTATIMLGLKMGMRSVDIRKLKLTDISWRKQTISFTQQKTGVYIELPLPVDVGNSLYRYITEGRPIVQDDTVFISNKEPYRPLKSSGSARNAMNHIFRRSRNEKEIGFHITRRTFASHMLRSGNTLPIIASTLGHAGIENIGSYLSTDDENLSKCTIGCEHIEYSGRYGL